MVRKLKTNVFKLSDGKYESLSELARAMGIAVSQIYRVKEGKRSINEKFIIGALKAFPGYKLDDLFYVASEQEPVINFKPMLTTRQVAELVGAHVNTVREWSKKGILPAFRISARGDRRFRQEDVDAFLKKRGK